MLARSAGDDGLVPAAAGDALWRELVEFGALEVGGAEGLGAVELALICWSLGGRLAAVPYVDSAALAYVVPGHGRAALGLSEPARSFAPAEPSTSLDGGRVTGEKSAGRVRRTRSTASQSPPPVPTGRPSRSSRRAAPASRSSRRRRSTRACSRRA